MHVYAYVYECVWVNKTRVQFYFLRLLRGNRRVYSEDRSWCLPSSWTTSSAHVTEGAGATIYRNTKGVLTQYTEKITRGLLKNFFFNNFYDLIASLKFIVIS